MHGSWTGELGNFCTAVGCSYIATNNTVVWQYNCTPLGQFNCTALGQYSFTLVQFHDISVLQFYGDVKYTVVKPGESRLATIGGYQIHQSKPEITKLKVAFFQKHILTWRYLIVKAEKLYLYTVQLKRVAVNAGIGSCAGTLGIWAALYLQTRFCGFSPDLMFFFGSIPRWVRAQYQ